MKWKREHEDIMTGLRDFLDEASREVRILQNRLAALQATGAHLRRRLQALVARQLEGDKWKPVM